MCLRAGDLADGSKDLDAASALLDRLVLAHSEDDDVLSTAAAIQVNDGLALQEVERLTHVLVLDLESVAVPVGASVIAVTPVGQFLMIVTRESTQ